VAKSILKYIMLTVVGLLIASLTYICPNVHALPDVDELTLLIYIGPNKYTFVNTVL